MSRVPSESGKALNGLQVAVQCAGPRGSFKVCLPAQVYPITTCLNATEPAGMPKAPSYLKRV